MNIIEDYFIYKNAENCNIKIFGDTFLANNKSCKEIFKIECEGKEFDLNDYNFLEFKKKKH